MKLQVSERLVAVLMSKAGIRGIPGPAGIQAREGKIYCCAVMDTFSRKIVGWSIDNAQDSTLVVNALDMAIKNRQPPEGGIVHAHHGVQFTPWAFTNKIRSSGLMPSFGTIGGCYDNAIFDYIEIFYTRQRRHSQPGYLSCRAGVTTYSDTRFRLIFTPKKITKLWGRSSCLGFSGRVSGL